MVKKYCLQCKTYSYSAAAQGKWICPICGCDLTKKPILPLEDIDRRGGAQPCSLTLIRGKS